MCLRFIFVMRMNLKIYKCIGRDKMIEVKNIFKKYENKYVKTEVLEDINFTVQDKSIVAITGVSGSGKTTLGLELILRLGNPSLVLVPSIAIREQWIDRFSYGFIKNENDYEMLFVFNCYGDNICRSK